MRSIYGKYNRDRDQRGKKRNCCRIIIQPYKKTDDPYDLKQYADTNKNQSSYTVFY